MFKIPRPPAFSKDGFNFLGNEFAQELKLNASDEQRIKGLDKATVMDNIYQQELSRLTQENQSQQSSPHFENNQAAIAALSNHLQHNFTTLIQFGKTVPSRRDVLPALITAETEVQNQFTQVYQDIISQKTPEEQNALSKNLTEQIKDIGRKVNGAPKCKTDEQRLVYNLAVDAAGDIEYKYRVAARRGISSDELPNASLNMMLINGLFDKLQSLQTPQAAPAAATSYVA